MAQTCVLKFARTDAGFRLRIEGCGTMQNSTLAETFVKEAMANPACSVVIDLSGVSYLDSTFLGCLVAMYRKHGSSRLRVAATKDQSRTLFGPTRLDVALKVTDEFPPVLGEYCTIEPQSVATSDVARHIMECHRQLADIPGPQQQAFSAIADHLARELEQRT